MLGCSQYNRGTVRSCSLSSLSSSVTYQFIQEGVVALAKVEEAYRAETETKETMEEVIEFASLYQLKRLHECHRRWSR